MSRAGPRDEGDSGMLASEKAGVWFVFSEENEPLGLLYRREGEALPVVGAEVADGAQWKTAEVVSFDELPSACAMRRFRVVVRLV